METSESCVFCRIVSGAAPRTVLYENDNVIVIKDKHPQSAVHWLVIPKKHIPDFLALDDTSLINLFKTVQKIIREQKITNYRIVNNGNGAAIVDHVHIHIMGSVGKFWNL